MNEDKTAIELEIESELYNWFDEYCRDGLMEMEDELVAVVEQYMQEHIDDAVGSGKALFDEAKDESEVFEEYEDEDLNPDG
jgi:uncharacterized protein YqeY